MRFLAEVRFLLSKPSFVGSYLKLMLSIRLQVYLIEAGNYKSYIVDEVLTSLPKVRVTSPGIRMDSN